jgi:hypothetical protein
MTTGGKGPRDPHADAAIVARLAAQDFDESSDDWVKLSRALIEYGYPIFVGWLISGEVYQAAAKRGRSGVRGLSRIPRGLKLAGDDAHDLTIQLLMVSIRHFHRTLRDGSWHEEGGASLTTYFIGRCLMDLPDVHDVWRRQEDRWTREVVDPADFDDGRFSTDPADAAIAAMQVDEILTRDGFEHIRVMFELAQSGYTMKEISDRFTEAGIPCTEAMVRTRLSRARSRAREMREQSERGADGE